MKPNNEGMLFLVPTPIGNLGDITFRAIEILKSVDIILAEDTRNAKKLLKHFSIETTLYSHHAFNEHKTIENLILRMQSGTRIALISDAGTPGISDPGFLITRACRKAQIPVSCLPGATAIIPAIAASGLSCDSFHFEGFLPHKKGRQTRLKYLCELPNTFILYESPFRLLKCLKELIEFCGEIRTACVCREISKIYEEYKDGSLQDIQEYYLKHPDKVKGEIVIVVSGK
ncbi:MAG TPA: 16S rRNA (cytidine(1402)-2'-O)-methyltransferase [Saprospiraceae bacterium]|nr:16S rRNA (cytidine(1402)-2'-O)-methyltransferase [Saprospiraceae bacterium]